MGSYLRGLCLEESIIKSQFCARYSGYPTECPSEWLVVGPENWLLNYIVCAHELHYLPVISFQRILRPHKSFEKQMS